MELSAAALHLRHYRAPCLLLPRSVSRPNLPPLRYPMVSPVAPLAVRLNHRDLEFPASSWNRLPVNFSTKRKSLALIPVRASKGEMKPLGSDSGRIVIASTITIVFAVLNRVLYKLALVPMKEYPFFLAQVTTFGYVAVYFSILLFRYRAGIVTKEMLALPKSRFIAVGILEALGVASGMSAGAMLPGPVIPILSQTFLVWQLILSCLILGRKYSFNQVFGCFLVTAGVVIAMASGANKDQFLSEVGLLWPILMVASSAFQAAASIIKEFVFIDGAKCLQGRPPDIFVVNSFGSGFQMSSALVSSLAATVAVPIAIYILSLPLPYIPGGASLNAYFVTGAAILFMGLIMYNIPQSAKQHHKND